MCSAPSASGLKGARGPAGGHHAILSGAVGGGTCASGLGGYSSVGRRGIEERAERCKGRAA